MKKLGERITRYRHSYKRAGSFTGKANAERYSEELPGSIVITHDNPEQFGVGVKYHVFRPTQ